MNPQQNQDRDRDPNRVSSNGHPPDCFDLPTTGAAGEALMASAHRWWLEAARAAGVDVSGFAPEASAADRIAWAKRMGLSIAALYSRFSTKRQHSTEDQVRTCVEHAARHGLYVVPELICIDEGKKGRKDDRDGINRLRRVFTGRHAEVLLVFKLSRLFRQVHRAIKFIQEDLVEEGMRVVAVTQAIDTANTKAWRLQVALHGVMDEELLGAIADHVREGLVGLFLKGFTTGALPVGYYAKEVPGGRPTRRGLARTMPALDEPVAEMIRLHYRLIAGGMDITEAWMKWRADGGPVDPRCDTGEMGYYAYRRLLSRPAYIGVWEFCRRRNFWMSKRDAIEQRPQPREEVKVLRCEELRIVDDELYWRVQRRLDALKTGPRPRRDPAARQYHLWDLVIGLFRCPHCDGQRFHMCGARGAYMHCPHPDCPVPAMVDRREAVEAVLAELSRMMSADAALVDEVMRSFALVKDEDGDELDRGIEASERKVQTLNRKMAALEKLLGDGTEDDCRRRQAEIRAAQGERDQEQLTLARLRRRKAGGRDKPVTRAQVEQALADLGGLLDAAAAGELGRDVVGKAADVFARLVGGAVRVHAQLRPGRKRWLVRGRFTPDLIGAVRAAVGADDAVAADVATEVEVWLRQPPRVDRLADEVYHLYAVERLGFRVINQMLERKYGQKIGSGNCCAAWRRWHETRGLPLPAPRGRNGRPRKRAG